ncbi:hypothetical protein PC9H_005815 [Pleurotus ostreatus]|uniref:Uncharacterized protein n=1 Tax=Pleurotus ostreatus TaxID=5322 RepID=A0A8H7A0M0_PLEOS|nr:uncharacterized protein PC9H_005815 [Pleurotus ostreatus]KAF7433849.1 hypothetical protein PC9H_005815 [Pleurotus ostreatus]
MAPRRSYWTPLSPVGGADGFRVSGASSAVTQQDNGRLERFSPDHDPGLAFDSSTTSAIRQTIRDAIWIDTDMLMDVTTTKIFALWGRKALSGVETAWTEVCMGLLLVYNIHNGRGLSTATLAATNAEREEDFEAGGEDVGKLVAILRRGAYVRAMEIRAHDNVIEGRGDVTVWNGGRVIDVRDILGDDEGFLAAFINLDICN